VKRVSASVTLAITAPRVKKQMVNGSTRPISMKMEMVLGGIGNPMDVVDVECVLLQACTTLMLDSKSARINACLMSLTAVRQFSI